MATRRTAHLDGDTARAAPDDIPDALVRIDGLAKSFGTARVLRDIDLVVPRGQCVGLVGESGSGKTTLARCLVGLETADAGRIEIEGNAALDPARASGADLAAFRRKEALGSGCALGKICLGTLICSFAQCALTISSHCLR